MAELGYVGLGRDGRRRRPRRLLDAGHTVTVWNRTAEKAEPLLEAGCALGRQPAGGRRAQRDHVHDGHEHRGGEAVAEGPDGILAGLAPGKVYVDMSTASPANTRELAEKVAAVGRSMLDAPVSGR